MNDLTRSYSVLDFGFVFFLIWWIRNDDICESVCLTNRPNTYKVLYVRLKFSIEWNQIVCLLLRQHHNNNNKQFMFRCCDNVIGRKPLTALIPWHCRLMRDRDHSWPNKETDTEGFAYHICIIWCAGRLIHSLSLRRHDRMSQTDLQCRDQSISQFVFMCEWTQHRHTQREFVELVFSSSSMQQRSTNNNNNKKGTEKNM